MGILSNIGRESGFLRLEMFGGEWEVSKVIFLLFFCIHLRNVVSFFSQNFLCFKVIEALL